MSPRDKGRYLRSKGWIGFSYAGVITWRDPLHPMNGTTDTGGAVELQQARDLTACDNVRNGNDTEATNPQVHRRPTR